MKSARLKDGGFNLTYGNKFSLDMLVTLTIRAGRKIELIAA
jgi:hypothetical protein